MELLVVEDDPRLSQYISEALTREGYNVEVCCSVEETEAYMSLQSHSPRLVILDRMLGRADGAMLIPKLKAQYHDVRIMVLSSLDMPSEKARVINSGADEYLSKPFSLDELTARLRLLLRRANSGSVSEVSILMLGNLSINLSTQHATVGPPVGSTAGTVVNSAKLDLTRKEFQLLSLLLSSPGRVYNRFQILDRVWDIERAVESNVVETTVKNLRRKLEELGCLARIESKRNMGYWIELSS